MQHAAWGSRYFDRVVDFIIYASFLSVMIWGILKGLGIINTPALIQQIPVITGSFGLLAIAYKIGRFVESVEQGFVRHEMKFDHIDKDIEFLKQRL